MWIWHDLYPYHFKENVTSFFYLEKSDHLRTKVFKKKRSNMTTPNLKLRIGEENLNMSNLEMLICHISPQKIVAFKFKAKDEHFFFQI